MNLATINTEKGFRHIYTCGSLHHQRCKVGCESLSFFLYLFRGLPVVEERSPATATRVVAAVVTSPACTSTRGLLKTGGVNDDINTPPCDRSIFQLHPTMPKRAYHHLSRCSLHVIASCVNYWEWSAQNCISNFVPPNGFQIYARQNDTHTTTITGTSKASRTKTTQPSQPSQPQTINTELNTKNQSTMALPVSSSPHK